MPDQHEQQFDVASEVEKYPSDSPAGTWSVCAHSKTVFSFYLNNEYLKVCK